MFDSIPPPFDFVVATFKILADARQSDLIGPLVVGQILAGGRRTATSWFLAGGIADQYKRAYTVLYFPRPMAGIVVVAFMRVSW